MRKSWRDQLFFALFFLLWAGLCVLSHWVGGGVLEHAREQSPSDAAPPAAVAEHDASPAAEPVYPVVADERLARAALMPLWNLPLFVGLGFIVRGDASAGLGYWILVILGSVYLPFFATLFAFFMVHAPRGMSGFPGVDEDDGSLKEEDEEDDD